MYRDQVQPLEKIYPLWRLLLPAIGLIAALVWASGIARITPEGPDLYQFDKVAHFFVFGLLGTLLFRSLRIEFLDRKRFIYAILGVMAFGVLDEVLQYFNPARTFDPYDWIADIFGPLLAIHLYRTWAWYRNLLEKRLWGRLAK